MKKPNYPILCIPHHWTSHEALTFVRFLEELTQAVWDLHGEGMSAILQASGYSGSMPTFPGPSRGGDLPEVSLPLDDDLPF